jgi:hypothetical protein
MPVLTNINGQSFKGGRGGTSLSLCFLPLSLIDSFPIEVGRLFLLLFLLALLALLEFLDKVPDIMLGIRGRLLSLDLVFGLIAALDCVACPC